jgi:hypothetical protein
MFAPRPDVVLHRLHGLQPANLGGIANLRAEEGARSQMPVDPDGLAEASSATEGIRTDLVGRFGSFLLASSEPFEPPFAKTVEAITSSLEADSRVVSVRPPEDTQEGWCIARQIFPSPGDEEGLVSGRDVLQTLQFGDFFLLSIKLHVWPEDEGVPAQYTVAWDGFLAVVTWRLRSEESTSQFEGHVVKEILGEALERLGLRLYLQGCNPDCTHKFAHTNVRFIPKPDNSEGFEYVEGEHWGEAEVRTPLMEDDELTSYFFMDLLLPMRSFAVLKNVGRRILEAETDGRVKLSELMQVNYRRARLQTLPFHKRTKARWASRGWLRRSHFLIARMWLTLANIEQLRREWGTLRFSFESTSNERGKRRLFERDYADEVDRVQSLDLELMRAAVQEMAERLDSRALLRVTAIAAVLGAIAGGLIAGFAGNGL